MCLCDLNILLTNIFICIRLLKKSFTFFVNFTFKENYKNKLMSSKGYKHSDEALGKIKKAARRKHSEKENKRQSERMRGVKMSDERHESYIEKRGVKVLQFSLEGKFIKEYITLKDAVKETGLGSVGDCCRGAQKRAGNFIFKFKRDNNDSIDDLKLKPKKESFILWKQPFEITKEMMKEKGRNYKGRDIGPFLRLCPNCRNDKTEYQTYDSMLAAERNNDWCKKCNKSTKGKSGAFSKKCNNDGCENITFYKRKGDYDKTIETPTICQDCMNADLSARYINGGLHKNKTEREKKIMMIKQIESRRKFWEANPEKYEKLLGKIGRCKRYTVHGVLCQGNAEKQYLEFLFREGKELPIRPKGIRVKSGLYYPDFEFEDRFIEIKSTYTYEKLMEDGNKQFMKIKELSKLKKKVEIIIIKDEKIFSTEII